MASLTTGTDEQKRAVQEFGEERQRQFDADPPKGLRGTPAHGWQCPNCGSAHGPDIATCPEPPRDGSLRERLKAARSLKRKSYVGNWG